MVKIANIKKQLTRLLQKEGRSNLQNEKGMFLVDTLFAVTLYAVLALNLASTGAFLIKAKNRTIYNSVAMQLAMERIEELSAVDPETLSDTNDLTEVITVGSRHFVRVVDVTVTPEGPRQVDVMVSAENPDIDVSVTTSNIFPLRGTR